MFSIIMMSCDKYKCLTSAFEACLDKYYPGHPEIHHVYGDDIWSRRLRTALENIQDDYVLVMLDDMLVREPVNIDLINDALETLKSNKKVAVVNFEHNYRPALPYSNN